MKHLFKVWKNIKPLIAMRSVLLFLDYDGTLTEIKDYPRFAEFPSGNRKKLRALSKIKGMTISIISGRRLNDVKQMTRISSLIYAGNHGFEIKGPKIDWTHSAASRSVKQLKNIFKKLRKQLKPFPGVWVENKKYTLSVHYRKLDPRKVAAAKKVLKKEIYFYLQSSSVKLTDGKKVWEIRPSTEWSKGLAVRWLIAQYGGRNTEQVLPIYVGDDLSDESAFNVVREHGIAVKVTRKSKEKTFADYYLRSPSEVAKFLDFLTETKKR